jgi:hypothetical protein
MLLRLFRLLRNSLSIQNLERKNQEPRQDIQDINVLQLLCQINLLVVYSFKC